MDQDFSFLKNSNNLDMFLNPKLKGLSVFEKKNNK
jgi:hypothetical protein